MPVLHTFTEKRAAHIVPRALLRKFPRFLAFWDQDASEAADLEGVVHAEESRYSCCTVDFSLMTLSTKPIFRTPRDHISAVECLKTGATHTPPTLRTALCVENKRSNGLRPNATSLAAAAGLSEIDSRPNYSTTLGSWKGSIACNPVEILGQARASA